MLDSNKNQVIPFLPEADITICMLNTYPNLVLTDQKELSKRNNEKNFYQTLGKVATLKRDIAGFEMRYNQFKKP